MGIGSSLRAVAAQFTESGPSKDPRGWVLRDFPCLPKASRPEALREAPPCRARSGRYRSDRNGKERPAQAGDALFQRGVISKWRSGSSKTARCHKILTVMAISRLNALRQYLKRRSPHRGRRREKTPDAGFYGRNDPHTTRYPVEEMSDRRGLFRRQSRGRRTRGPARKGGTLRHKPPERQSDLPLPDTACPTPDG